jgi:hypothetical protein
MGRSSRHSEEHYPDREHKRIYLPKAPAKLVIDLSILLRRLAGVFRQEIDGATFAAELLLRCRLAGADEGRPGTRGGKIIVASGAHSHG